MAKKDLIEHLRRALEREEKELADFENAIAKYHLRIHERDVNGERDVTERHRQFHITAVEEYRRLLRAWDTN